MAFASVVFALGATFAMGIAIFFLVQALASVSAKASQGAATRKRLSDAAYSGVSAAAAEMDVAETGVIAEWLARNPIGRQVAENIRTAGLTPRPAELMGRVLIGAAVTFVALTLMLRNPLPGLVLTAGGLAFAYFWVQGAAEARLERMRAQLPDAFTLVGNSLASGLSLPQAISYAASETEAPLGPQLYRLVDDVSAGFSLPSALERFRASVPLRELQTISTAMEIQHRVGGNVREMLEQATASVRQSLELRMSLRAQTAQGRMSAKVVGLLPLGLMGLMSLMMDDYLTTFFAKPAGVVMFTLALTADIVGFVLIRKILDIEV